MAGSDKAIVKKTHYWRPLALLGLALLGLALRLYGLNWDQGNSFHPDERQIMFHVTVLSWPHSLAQFLDPVNSPLNPHFFAYGSFPLYLLAGLGCGLALATKFSAAPLIVPLFVAAALRGRQHGLFQALGVFFSSLTTTGLIFLIAMPYALLDWTNFREQVAAQGDLARGLVDLPYVRQFAGTIPYLYEAQNIVLWGLGVMVGLGAFVGFCWLLWRLWKRLDSPWLVVLAWVVPYSIIVGSFYVKFMRYMLPIYPFLTLMAAAFLVTLLYRERARDRRFSLAALPIGATVLVLAGTAFQGLALLNVYSQPNTRIQASLWMYSHLKPGSVLTYEQWDDPLPVPVGNNNPSQFVQATYPDASGQVQTGLDLYGDDTLQKAQQLAHLLANIDCITMSTDRLDKSIPRLPQRYPLTIHYYQLLFSGQLGFYLAAHFENHPNLFGVTLDDSNADESYSVFDHPTVRIFVRENPYPYTPDQLLQKLLAGVKLPATSSTGNS